LTLAELNSFGLPAFIATVGKAFERAPWVAQRAYAHAPFASVEALHRAMMDAVHAASTEEKRALLSAYPAMEAMEMDDALTELSKLTRERLDAMFGEGMR
jgi:2-oxo-4-hydroxy-4-carboxy-5-ureidoimidazoline decarboxylase